MNENQDHFELLRKIHKKPEVTQRALANELGFSLGKLNYCLKALRTKGLIKIKNFKKNPKKINYFYVLTPSGLAAKTINTGKKVVEGAKEIVDDVKKKIN